MARRLAGEVRGLRWKVSALLGAILTVPLAVGFTIADFVSVGHTSWGSVAWWLFVWAGSSLAFAGWIWEHATWLLVRHGSRDSHLHEPSTGQWASDL